MPIAVFDEVNSQIRVYGKPSIVTAKDQNRPLGKGLVNLSKEGLINNYRALVEIFEAENSQSRPEEPNENPARGSKAIFDQAQGIVNYPGSSWHKIKVKVVGE